MTRSPPAYTARAAGEAARAVDPDRYVALACDPARSVVVQACAGAGKTWLLVSRIVRCLLDGAAPQDILAITFTRKAAAEMRERLLALLRDWSDCDDSRLRAELVQRGIAQPTPELLARARDLYPRLLAGGQMPTLSTFHGWFAQLLLAAPHRFGVPPQFELLDDTDAWVEQAWRALLQQLAAEPELRQCYRELVAAQGRGGAAQLIRLVLERRAEFRLAAAHGGLASGMDAPAPEPWDRWLVGWQGQLQRWCAAWGEAGGEHAKRALVRADAALQAAAAGDADAAADALQQLLLTEAGTARAPNPVMTNAVVAKLDTDGGDCRADWSQRAADCLALAAAHDALRIEQLQALALRLGAALVLQYEALKDAGSSLDFSDLETYAGQLLADPELAAQVQQRLDRRYRQLLIDEFQDTNPVQWQALRAWLDAYSGDAQRPAVFVVGDAKQSIYRFRRADPLVFDAATTFLQQGFDAVLLSAQHTRRLSQAVLDWVNRVFVHAPGMDFVPHTGSSTLAGAVGLLPPLPPISAPSEVADRPDRASRMRASLTEADLDPEIGDVERDAARIAAWLAARLQQPLPQADGGSRPTRPGDVLLLLRKRRDRMPLYWSALLLAGIPAVSGDPDARLLETLEASDLLALLTVLVSPGSDLELAQVLKSPIVGVDDTALLTIARAARAARSSWWVALQRLHADGGAPAAAALWFERAQVWRQALGRLPVHDLLDRIIAEQGLRQRYAALLPAAVVPQALANLDAFLHLCLDLRGGRLLSPYALVRELRRGLAHAPIPELASLDAVRLSTIHGAKGLEAEIVILADADARPQGGGAVALLDWQPEQPAPRHFSLQVSSRRLHPAQQPIQQREQQMAEREDWNLLYVAMTRAKQQLWVSALPGRGAPGWSARLQPEGLQLAQADLDAAPVTARAVPPLQQPGLDLGWSGEGAAAPEPASRASRIGQAMHRLLEVATALAPSSELRLPLRVALQFELDAEAAAAAESAAARILGSAQTRVFFDPARLRWARNEVDVGWSADGDAGWGRIDRLVELDDAVWVLDYKLAAGGLDPTRYAAVLQRYASAAASLRPGKPVRVGLLGSDGGLREWRAGDADAIARS